LIVPGIGLGLLIIPVLSITGWMEIKILHWRRGPRLGKNFVR